ncbi:MAG: hypothetical protein HQ477_11500 [Chloroflexi bacterium]|nr:hypothetical protein [Chloroflexota bacterium]
MNVLRHRITVLMLVITALAILPVATAFAHGDVDQYALTVDGVWNGGANGSVPAQFQIVAQEFIPEVNGVSGVDLKLYHAKFVEGDITVSIYADPGQSLPGYPNWGAPLGTTTQSVSVGDPSSPSAAGFAIVHIDFDEVVIVSPDEKHILALSNTPQYLNWAHHYANPGTDVFPGVSGLIRFSSGYTYYLNTADRQDFLFSTYVGIPILDPDDDGDGFPASGDCNDGDPSINPDALETPYDGIDQDCDGADLIDVDEDGFAGIQVGGSDCNDSQATVNPEAPELANGVDDDCDGVIDDASGLLTASGITGLGIGKAPGLTKGFNPNSEAANHAGKKK